MIRNFRDIKLDDGLTPEHGVMLLATSDENASHIFGVKEASITSTSEVTGSFIRPDGVTIALTGTAAAGAAYVTLPEEAYYYSGTYTLTVCVDGMTLRYITGNIVAANSDVMLDGGTYSLEYLMALINEKIAEPATEGSEDDVLISDGNGGTEWASPAVLNSAGKLNVGGTNYIMRTGTAGAAGYITFVLED